MQNKIGHWFGDRWAFWLLALLNGFAWSWVFLIDDAKLSNNAFTGYLTITIVFLIIVFISTACFWYAIKYLNKDIKKSKNWLVVPKIFFVWAFVEILVSWLLAVIWIGRNGSWTTLLPFSTLSPWLMLTPLGYISRFVGFYGVSAAFVTAIFVFASKKLRRYAALYCAVIALATVLTWSLYKTPNGVAVKTTIAAENVGSPTKVHAADSQFVVLPEYGLDQNTNKNIATRFDTSQKVYFVGSRQVSGQQGFSNTLVYGDNKTGYLKQEQKNRLIPGGEYLAFPVEVLLRLFAKDTYTNFEVTRAVVKGHDKMVPFAFTDWLKVGAAACSSVIATEDYRALVNQGAAVLTNSASLDIFRGSRLFNWQHRGLAKFMAMANARPMLQSSNNWPAFALDQNGKQLAQVQPVGSAQVTVTTSSKKTPYTYLGEWPAYIGGIWLGIDLILYLRSLSKPKHLSTPNLKTA